MIANRFSGIPKILWALMVLPLIPRLYAYREPVEMDLAMYSVIAHELLGGRSLYTDLWEHKPPAVFLPIMLAQGVAGYGQGSVFLLGTACSILTLVTIYLAASAGGRGQRAGLWAAAFWAIVSADVLLQADQPNVEAFMNPCFAGAFALLAGASGKTADRARWLGVGALITMASLFKPIAVFFAIAMALAHVISPPQNTSRKIACFDVLLIAGVGFAVWSLFFLYFFLAGNFEEFWQTLFVFNRYYAGNIFRNLWQGLSPSLLISREAFGIFPLIALSILGMALCRWRPWTRTSALFLAYVLATFTMVASPGKFFPHYYQLWLPVLSMGAAWVIDDILKNSTVVVSRALRLAGPVVLIGLLALQANYMRFSPEGWSQLKFGWRFINTKLASIKIDNILLPNETFYAWGFESGLYFYTQRSPVSGMLNYTPLLNGPMREKYSIRVRDQLAQNMPDLFVVPPVKGINLPLYKWISQQYQPFPNQAAFTPYKFYYLTGSALEKRIRPPAPPE